MHGGVKAALSIVMPVLDEAAGIVDALMPLQAWRAQGIEVVVVDGGSKDGTAALAAPLADRVIASARGRAVQMNAGARVANGNTLLFLHADTRLPAHAPALVASALAAGRVWGRFDVRIDGRSPWLRPTAWLMNRRSCLTGIATGDQCIFVRRDAFDAVGGYPPIPLMEDIALSRLLKARSRPACIASRAVTSGRRWEKHGVWRTVFLMWRLRLRYFFGADPRALAIEYGYAPGD